MSTTRLRAPRLSHAGQLSIIAILAVLVTPSSAFAIDSDAGPGFDFRLRQPRGFSLARRISPGTVPAKDDRPASDPMTSVPAAAPPAAADRDASGPDLGFDLLGPDAAAPKPVPVDEAKVKLRRKMLTWHPLLGIGLLICETATIVVGQLNYNDRFGGGPSSGRYELPHAVLAGTTTVLFAGTGLLAALAPNPIGKDHQGVDRVLVHKIGMIAATVGMLAEIGLGIYTAHREGYLNQASYARAHLIIGYSTAAATYVGVGSIVF